MAAKSLSKEQIRGKLLQGTFANSTPPARLSDPIVDTPMVLTLEQLRPYDHNPRLNRNPRYDDLRASILSRGLDAPPPVTRRPGEEHFIIRNGGNTRLAPNGALIQGADVALIAGKNLTNAGTLKATSNLSAVAGQDMVNSGLVQAGERLDLLASKDLTNKAGGVITGKDVALTSVTGDVVNERTVTTSEIAYGKDLVRNDYVDSAARVESANDLNISAGRDINNIGGTFQGGRDVVLNAGRDVNIVSVQTTNSLDRGINRNSSTTTQYSASINSGRDISVKAGSDLNVVASQIDAKRDITMDAVENATISSAANEEHFLYKSKKLTIQEDHVNQVKAEITAGGNVDLNAGKNLTMIASRIAAGDEAYLAAGDKLQLLAAPNSDYSLFDEKKKGSWGSKKTQRDEVTDVKNIGSEITTGGDLSLVSVGDQRYQVAKLNSGKDLTLDSGGSITFEAVKDLHQETHEKSNNSMAWTSMSGKGHTDETVRQTQMIAQGELVIKAVDGLKIDIKQVNQQTVHQVIETMVAADPQLAWLAEAEKRGDVDWRRVEEIHTSFKYSHSGLGPAAQVILAIALAVVTGGAGLGAGLVGASAGTFTAGFANTVLAAVMNNAANSMISNKGNLSSTFKDITSKDAMKGYVVSGLMGGIAGTLGYDPTKLGFDWNSAGQVVLKTGADTLVQTAINGGSLGDNFANNLLGAVINIAGAVAANQIGEINQVDGSPTKIAAHALLGGLKSMAMGGDFQTGALAGGANEAMVQYLAGLVLPDNYNPNLPGNQQAQINLTAMSQLLGVLAAVVTGGDPEIAANIAANATQYNYLSHSDLERASKELLGCGSDTICAENAYAKYHDLSVKQSAKAFVDCANDRNACPVLSKIVADAQADAARFKDMASSASPAVALKINMLIAENNSFQNDLAGITTGNIANVLVASYGLSPEHAAEIVAAVVATVAAMNGAKSGNGAKGGPASNLNPTSAMTDAEAGTSGLAKIGSLKGEPELPPKNASPDMIRSIERQNEASKGLAQAGYDVEQLANSGKKGANPDLRINGELADVFSPITNSPISVLKTITGKVETQASNIVVNLADSPLTFDQIENALRSNPVEGLKKLYLMKGGEFRVIGVAK